MQTALLPLHTKHTWEITSIRSIGIRVDWRVDEHLDFADRLPG
jgi:hypothetical protein